MAVSTYTIKTNDVIHETNIDFVKRVINMPVHLMQYDQTLPIIAVELFKDDEPYHLPDNNNIYVYVRWGLKDHSFIHKPVLGCNSARNIVYFAVEQQMVLFEGKLNPILELIIQEPYTDSTGIMYSKRVAGSSYINIEIDRNPIQRDDIKSAYSLDHLVDVDLITINPTVSGNEPIAHAIGFSGTNYILPSGSIVVPNSPATGPDVEDLTSIKIDNDTFRISGSFTAEKKENDTVTPIECIVFEKL